MKVTVSSIGREFLFWGFFFTPFTSLRFGAVGPGEILILSAALLNFVSGRKTIRLDVKLSVFYQLWCGFLFVSVLGIASNILFQHLPSGRPGTMAFDLSAYIFIFGSIVLIGDHSIRDLEFSVRFFRRLFNYWAFTYTALYGLSFSTDSIFGLPLRYHQYFSPLVENVHQASSITCAMGFVMLYTGLTAPQLHVKVLSFFAAILFVKMALDSGSTKAMLGVLVGALVSASNLLLYRASGQGRAVLNFIALIIILSLAAVITYRYTDELIDLAKLFFTENDGAGARESLYLVGFNHAMDSFLVGYGPGSHTPYGAGFSDAHNTILTVFLQTGLLGVIVFSRFIVQLLKGSFSNFALIGATSAVGMYFLGGDILRRLPIWIILMGIWFFAAQQTKKTRDIKS